MANTNSDQSFRLVRRDVRGWFLLLAGATLGALFLTLLDGQPQPIRGWLAYFTVLAASGLLLLISYHWLVPREAGSWLVWALVGAIAVRLIVAVALSRGLPVYGYEESVQQAGYVFQDAFTRDMDAWELSQSNASLASSFDRPEGSDQYGGMMFISAVVYRYLGGGVHRPLLVSALTTLTSAGALLFAWAFVRSVFDLGAAVISTWIMVVYPEFVLLSASQMREPFIILGTAISLYGYARIRQADLKLGGALVVMGLVLMIPISPPFAFFTFVIVAGAWLLEKRTPLIENRLYLLLLAGLAVLSVFVTVRAWAAFDPSGGGDPVDIIRRWFQEGAAWQMFLLEQGSGWAQKVFEIAPEWSHLPLATAYGVIQPFLPAALADHTGAFLWQAIAIIRSFGWAALLSLLIYALLAALRKSGYRSLETYLGLVSWAAILLASYRAAGDQWDNPRYRAAMLVPQAALAGWAWYQAREQDSPWLARTFLLVGVAMAVFFHWFAGRYFGTPRLDLFETLGAIVLAVGIVLVIIILRDRRRTAI